MPVPERSSSKDQQPLPFLVSPIPACLDTRSVSARVNAMVVSCHETVDSGVMSVTLTRTQMLDNHSNPVYSLLLTLQSERSMQHCKALLLCTLGAARRVSQAAKDIVHPPSRACRNTFITVLALHRNILLQVIDRNVAGILLLGT